MLKDLLRKCEKCEFTKRHNGLSVCAMRERVNRYTVNFAYMLTCPVYYGNMVSGRKRLRIGAGAW